MAIPPRDPDTMTQPQVPRTPRTPTNAYEVELPPTVATNVFSGGRYLIQRGRIMPGVDVAALPTAVQRYVRAQLGQQAPPVPRTPRAPQAPRMPGARVQVPREELPPVEKPPKFAINRVDDGHLAPRKEVQTIYYARPAWMIGTVQDSRNIYLLKQRYPGARILMAKVGEHKDRMRDDPFEIRAHVKMGKFHKRVLKADLVVAVESQPNALSSGVFSEVRKAQKNQVQVRVLQGNHLKKITASQVIPDAVKRSQATTWARIKTN